MNRLYKQSALSDSLAPEEGGHGLPAAARDFTTGHQEPAMFRLDIKRSLQLHRKLALFVAVVGVALAVAYFLKLWPTYIAQSLVYIQPQTPRVMDQGGTGRWPYDGSTYESYIQQQMVSVTRDDVMAAALKKMDGGWQGSGESDQAAIERLKRAIEVTRNGAYQFAVGAHAANPDMAAQLANAVSTSYIESSSRDQKVGDSQRLTELRAERQRIQDELTADRTEQEALNKQLGVASIGTTTPDHFDEDITQTRTELIKARTDRDEAAAKFSAMGADQGLSSAAIDAEADDIASADAGLASMKTSLNQRRATLLTQMANITPNHPEYKQDAEELAKINSTIDSMMKDLRSKAAARIQQRLRTNLEQTAGVETQLNGQLRQLVGAAGTATSKLQRANDLAADITRLQTRFTTVDELLHNLMLEDSAPGSAFITAAAVPPIHPAKSGVIRNSIVMAMAGLFLAMLAAVAAHKMDSKIYIGSDVENILGVVPMAQLPDFNEVSDEVADEHLLRLATAIEYGRKQGELKSCIFTGTGSGTGVTSVATRIREMLETLGRSTVLVDASGTPPPAPRVAANGLASEQGLVATQRGSRSSALLHQMSEETRTQEDSLVLTDTAPLVVSAETAYLARFVDCVIVVIESGVTTRQQLREVATTLQRLNVSAVGFVLNRVGMAKADPEFRQSVRAVANHLHSQSRSTSRRTVRNRPAAAAIPAPVMQERQQPVATRVQPLPATQDPASPLAPSRQSAADPFWTGAPPVPQQTPQRGGWLTQGTDANLTQPVAGSDTPWWLADGSQRVNAPQPVPVPVPHPARPREPEPAATFQPAAPAPAPQSEAPPLQTWDRPPAVTTGSAPEADYEEGPQDAATRLSGLRNLLFSLGLKNLNSSRDADGPGDPSFQQNEQENDYAGYTRVITSPSTGDPLAMAPSGSQVTTAPRLVTALPEVLPPRTIETAGRDESVDSDGTNRRDRRDNYDEVAILPSWRGQYRKK